MPCGTRRAGEKQGTAGILVESVDELGPPLQLKTQGIEQSIDMAFLIAELLKQERAGKVKPIPAVAGF